MTQPTSAATGVISSCSRLVGFNLLFVKYNINNDLDIATHFLLCTSRVVQKLPSSLHCPSPPITRAPLRFVYGTGAGRGNSARETNPSAIFYSRSTTTDWGLNSTLRPKSQPGVQLLNGHSAKGCTVNAHSEPMKEPVAATKPHSPESQRLCPD